MLELRHTITNLVVVALVSNEDVHGKVRVGGRIEGAHRESESIAGQPVPEQRRATGRAETPARLTRRLIPGNAIVTADRYRRLQRRWRQNNGLSVCGKCRNDKRPAQEGRTSLRM